MRIQLMPEVVPIELVLVEVEAHNVLTLVEVVVRNVRMVEVEGHDVRMEGEEVCGVLMAAAEGHVLMVEVVGW